MAESRKGVGITADRSYLNVTPMGDVVAVYLEGDDPVEANRKFAASKGPFDVWFKTGAGEAFGIDFNQPLPPIEEIWEWQADKV